MDSEIKCVFYGCRGQAGHYMFTDIGKVSDAVLERQGWPTDSQLDASRLFLPHPEMKDHGRCTYLPAMNVTVFSWWNNVYDQRGKVNSHIMYKGEQIPSTMWHVFGIYFPDIRKDHIKPFIGITY